MVSGVRKERDKIKPRVLFLDSTSTSTTLKLVALYNFDSLENTQYSQYKFNLYFDRKVETKVWQHECLNWILSILWLFAISQILIFSLNQFHEHIWT